MGSNVLNNNKGLKDGLDRDNDVALLFQMYKDWVGRKHINTLNDAYCYSIGMSGSNTKDDDIKFKAKVLSGGIEEYRFKSVIEFVNIVESGSVSLNISIKYRVTHISIHGRVLQDSRIETVEDLYVYCLGILDIHNLKGIYHENRNENN